MKILDFIVTIAVIILAALYLIRRYKNRPIDSGCIGCPYAENGGCSLNKNKKDSECDSVLNKNS
jgi:hypothetical protein